MRKPGAAAPPRRSGRPETRPTEATRRALIGAAIAVFGERGYEAASVRTITARANVNQGAITYHFGGKDGLYREVLRTVRNALSEQPLLDLRSVEAHEPAEALKLFLRQTLAPLAEGAKLKRYLRVFAWEQLKPTPVRRRLSREEPFPTVLLAEAIVRRSLPTAEAKTVAIATAWLMGQTTTFIRDAEWLAQPPLGLRFDRNSVDDLVETLTFLCLRGLAFPAVNPDALSVTQALVAQGG